MRVRTITALLAITGIFVVFIRMRKPPQHPDIPRPHAGAVFHDVSFQSASLGRSMRYRIILPESKPSVRLPVLYLLHGAGDVPEDWTANTDIAHWTASGLVLVLVQGDNSYYLNAVSRPLFSRRPDRYEDYVTHDLIAEIESKFPVGGSRVKRAIMGASMGGFGAIVLSVHHPDLYSLTIAMSPPVDAPRRKFTWRRLQQSLGYRRIFGADGSATRKAADPFELLKSPNHALWEPIYVTYGQSESLAEPIQRFIHAAKEHHIQVESHAAPGGHNWGQWETQLRWIEPTVLNWAKQW